MQTDDCFVACSNEVGGVGKTMLTAAVVRDARVREAFQLIAWLNMSQKPDLMQLQQRLYSQLSDNKTMPSQVAESVEGQLTELARTCAKHVVLITLDGASY